ncbi:helix-turn-helix domain-containing protein [Cetobacterium sp.]|uniref:helix-turn-helix domain-containing protein n=1 Tax=Cetobacterium sp. TaxID=2071632 RepID=UPI003EE71D03
MRFGEVLKNIRLKKNDSFRKLGAKMGTAFTYIDKIEKGISPVSENFFNKIIKVYPEYESELTAAYFKEVLPGTIVENTDTKLIPAKDFLTTQKIKIYSCNSKTEGIISKKFEYKEMIIPMNFKFNEKDFCINILGSDFVGFFDNDVILVEKTTAPIQMLNKKIVVIKKNDSLFIKKVEIKNYTPFLLSLNEVYEPIEYSEDCVIVGVITKLLYRDLSEINI